MLAAMEAVQAIKAADVLWQIRHSTQYDAVKHAAAKHAAACYHLGEAGVSQKTIASLRLEHRQC